MMRCLQGSFAMLILSMVFGVASAQAATLYLDPEQATINPGDTVVMSVRVNPAPGECINVVDAVITYDPAVQPVDISRGQSIMPLWVEEPQIDRDNNRITFAGGIPNGYCGRIQGDPRLTNEVLKIVFQVPGLRVGYGDQSPTTTVQFSDQTSVYRNDGRGTLAELTTNSATLVVGQRPSGTVRNDWVELVQADDQVPEEFSITLQRDDKIYNKKYFIIFNTTDKQTGIAHYEVIEEPLEEAGLFGWGAADAPWQRVRSPYVLKDQSLNSTVRVKAVDKAGNEYIATLVPEESLRGVSLMTVVEYVIIVVGALVVLLFGAFLGYRYVPRIIARRRARRAEKQAVSEDQDEDEYEYVEEWVEVEVDEDGNVIDDETRS